MRRLLATLLIGCGSRTALDAPRGAHAPDAEPPIVDAGPSPEASLCFVEVSDAGDKVTALPAQLALGAEHACLRAGLDVWCWGGDRNGELGDGKTLARSRPVRVNMVSTVEIASGSGFDVCGGSRGSHTCARVPDGTVRCWGANVDGEAMQSAAKSTPFPTLVPGLVNVIQIAVSGNHNCAVLTDRTARCWGDNDHGTLGDGTIGGGKKGLVMVVGLTNVEKLALGHVSSCALLSDRSVSCWGDGVLGQLGDGTTSARGTPAAVSSLGPTTDVSSFWFHTCALLLDRTVACWGWNQAGQLGDGTKSDRSIPVKVSGLSDVLQISAGVNHTCAVLVDGSVRCWGSNSFGQLGNGGGASQTKPVIVTNLAGAVEVHAGLLHTCARTLDGSVWCWGWNDDGQVGDGTTLARSVPVRVL